MRVSLPKTKHIERHRRFQIIVTMGMIGSAVVVMIDPAYALHSVVANTLSSLIWLWE